LKCDDIAFITLPGAGHIENHLESEKIFASIGDTVNLTCNINTREVDWHFKDKNLTTTIISYGLQLQVAQPNIYDFEDFSNSFRLNDYDLRNDQQILKYRVSSDRQFTHMLSLYVQGEQDEGSYQCVDSKSEQPIKKTIRIVLSKLSTLKSIRHV
jgi:hypothetical protein